MLQYKQLHLIGIFSLLLSLSACGQSGGSSSYSEKVMSVEETEISQPTSFLKADGNYNKNLFGTKLKVHGTITSSTSVATFKDAVIQITFYSATQTELFNKNYTIYNYFPPHSTVEFELKTENYKDVESIGVAVVGAKAK
jgi:hypothetical protein